MKHIGSGVARGGGAMGAVAPLRFRRREKRKIKLRVGPMHVKLPPFNHFQSKII